MTLKTNLRQFLDTEGNVYQLTEQANRVFEFVTNIVLSVSDNIKDQTTEQPLVDVGLKCNARANGVSCDGSIQGKIITTDLIEWQCDSCIAVGTISHWQGSLWDKQKRTFH